MPESPVGLVDAPEVADLLGVAPHAEALADFLLKCATPMTVSVQGSWGSGKSSVMAMAVNRVRARADSSVKVVEFNTWQYSQFNLGEQLAANLIRRIADAVAPPAASQEQLDRKRKLKQHLGTLALAGADFLFEEAAAWVPQGQKLTSFWKKLNERAKQGKLRVEPADCVEAITELRDTFANLVAESGERVIVLIDDLDRLEPRRAVELLESIKIFLDVPGCVFVLAVDIEIVEEGVSARYGSSGDASKDAARGRRYFEKLIQVPFHVPVYAYDVTELLEAGVRAAGLTTGEHAKSYLSFAREVGSSNPRAVKRLTNTLALHKLVKTAESPDSSVGDQGGLDLFAMLCLQSAHPDVAAFVYQLQYEGAGAKELVRLIERGEEGEEDDSWVPENKQMGDGRVWAEAWGAAKNMLYMLRKHFSGGEDGTINEQRFRIASEQAADADGRPGQWNLIADPEGMRERLSELGINGRDVDWGFEFADAASEFLVPVGQSGRMWTLNFADPGHRGPKRFGMLSFGVNRMGLSIERVARANESEETLRGLGEKWARELGVEFGKGSELPRLEVSASDALPVFARVRWYGREPLRPEVLARFVRELVVGSGGEATPV
ncbi:KAP family P-loop NTPase fold protein [Leucobacter chromiireducens]|uniref:KAP family P-loop NTPase fold protein n=1 Tax=Leucobacter chromiireducens TaxID=283877 RepID=UPI0019291EC6|nr:P-loop NTPase fold protein [Leucobacter chromiireducens]